MVGLGPDSRVSVVASSLPAAGDVSWHVPNGVEAALAVPGVVRGTTANCFERFERGRQLGWHVAVIKSGRSPREEFFGALCAK